MSLPWRVIGSLDDLSLDGIDAVAADVDYTLMDFGYAHEQAMSELERSFGTQLRRWMDGAFQLVLDGSRKLDSEPWEARDAYRDFLARMKLRQGPDAPFKKWSRDTWLECANEELNLGLGLEDIERARNTYWHTLRDASVLYPDAAAFASTLAERNIPLVLMTASDSVMRMYPGIGFRYEAEFARSCKADRLIVLPLHAADIIIGDPVDKPQPAFFDFVDEAMKELGFSDTSRLVAVGDSPRSDIEVPAQRGYQAYHIKRP